MPTSRTLEEIGIDIDIMQSRIDEHRGLVEEYEAELSDLEMEQAEAEHAANPEPYCTYSIRDTTYDVQWGYDRDGNPENAEWRVRGGGWIHPPVSGSRDGANFLAEILEGVYRAGYTDGSGCPF